MDSYVSARMHRRLFLWFGAAIFVAGLSTVSLMVLMNRLVSSPDHTPSKSLSAFLAQRYVDVWDDPQRRQALGRDLQDDFGAHIEVTDAHGTVLDRFGECSKRGIEVQVLRRSTVLGTVHVCGGGWPHDSVWWRVALPLVSVGLVLWAAAGRLARRLTKPLADLTRVAQDIGAGRLASRARLGRRQAGEVGVLAAAINDMASKIERQMADQLALLAAVSHELRTPLARLRVLLELGRDQTTPLPDVFDNIEREIIDMDALMGQLLASSRLDFAAVKKQRLDGAEIARRALERSMVSVDVLRVEVVQTGDTAPDVAAEDGSVAAQMPASALAFWGDPTLIASALRNLVENAKKHGGGVRLFRVSREGAELRFEVEDDGPGFTGRPDDMFAPFTQGPRDPASDPTSLGLGLGLALVRRIAHVHGGRAYAENKPGGGARVGLVLYAALANQIPTAAPPVAERLSQA